jgi:hypothetical protein
VTATYRPVGPWWTLDAPSLRLPGPDGRAVEIWTTGAGPSVLLVHRPGADHESWLPLLPHLAPRFTVHALRATDGAADAHDVAVAIAGLDARLVVADGDAAVSALAGLPAGGRGGAVALLDPPRDLPPSAAAPHVLARGASPGELAEAITTALAAGP